MFERIAITMAAPNAQAAQASFDAFNEAVAAANAAEAAGITIPPYDHNTIQNKLSPPRVREQRVAPGAPGRAHAGISKLKL